MSLGKMFRHQELVRNCSLLASAAIFFVVAGFADSRTLSEANAEVGRQTGTKSPIELIDKPNLLDKIQRSEATVDLLVANLGSLDLTRRRQAATAIVALRDHDSTVSQRIIELGYSGQVNSMVQWHALSLLAELRTSSPSAVQEAAHHLSFSWTPALGGQGELVRSHAASYVVVRSSLVALPILSNLIASSPLPQENKRVEGQALACAVSIMGSATQSWLQDEASHSSQQKSKAALQRAATFVSTRWKPDVTSDVPSFLYGFGAAQALDESVNPTFLSTVDSSKYKINWNAPEGLSKGLPQAKIALSAAPSTERAMADTLLPLQLIKNGIVRRLTATQKDKQIQAYPKEAQTDAIRVLGCLRSIPDAGVIWERLRVTSREHPIEEDNSEDTAACLRALGQIDVPAARFLANRIANHWAADQQRAATYALSKVMGRYAVFFIKAEIAKRQVTGPDGSREDDRQSDNEQIKRLQAMLKLGQDKKWFEGEYYGYGDPHAYDLVFPESEPGPKR